MALARKTTPSTQPLLFDLEPDWAPHWWGMPEFIMGDARPRYRITVNLYSLDDLREFGHRLGMKVSPATDSLTFPPEEVDKPADWIYADET